MKNNNIACKKCGGKDAPLHTNYQCGKCYIPHNWKNGRCELCKVSYFRSNGLDDEEKSNNRGMTQAPMQTFYMLNDGKCSIVDTEPECKGEVEEISFGDFEYKEFPDGSGMLILK